MCDEIASSEESAAQVEADWQEAAFKLCGRPMPFDAYADDPSEALRENAAACVASLERDIHTALAFNGSLIVTAASEFAGVDTSLVPEFQGE